MVELKLRLFSLFCHLWLVLLTSPSVTRGHVGITLRSSWNHTAVFKSYSYNTFFDKTANVEDYQESGYLHEVGSEDSCSGVATIRNFTNSSRSWFAILNSIPSCFDSAVANISNAGYELVLIGNTSGHNSSSPLSLYSQDFPIVLISKSYTDYLIKNALSEFSSPDVLVTVSVNNTLFVVVVSIVGALVIVVIVILLLLLLICVLKCCVTLESEAAPGITNNNSTNIQLLAESTTVSQRPLGTKWTKRLPKKRYSNMSCTVESCAICCSELKAGDSVRLLPCGHNTFHTHCLDDWLRYRRTCPLCRHDVTKKVKAQTVSSFENVDCNTPLIPDRQTV